VYGVTVGQIREMAAERLACQQELQEVRLDSLRQARVITEQQVVAGGHLRLIADGQRKYDMLDRDFLTVRRNYASCVETNGRLRMWATIGKAAPIGIALYIAALILTH
jgi:hypothetical protein